MATLVLTAVGTALGGPLGGALGAILGQSADAMLFAPKARQGPRLSDLKVQTSSYGDAIPQIFGTMRVAGTVIWATDLQERRQSRSAGKGRPRQVDYSYSASFAVALSARPIGSIGRIWADGKLLRDAGGRFAEPVTFRTYAGSADQAVDPLIASAVGIDRTSGFRGIAYAMFEALDLAAFGNRIPQLSFEVVADAAPVAAAAIGSALLNRPAAAQTGAVQGDAALSGYAAGGRVRDALAPLVAFADLGLQHRAGQAVLANPYWNDDSDAAADPGAVLVHPAAPLRAEEDRRTPLAKMPALVMLRHFDPARDFQTSQQAAEVAGGRGPARMVEVPGAIDPAAAQQQARVLARAAGDARRGVTVRAGMGAVALPVGQAIEFSIDGVTALWRIAERCVDGGGVTLLLIRHAAAGPPAPAGPADGGDALVAPALPGTEATLVILDLPGDGETPRSVPLRMVAAGGAEAGWRGADLWWVGDSNGEPEPIGRISDALALGALDQPLGPPGSWLIDWARPATVRLAHDGMTMANISEAALVGGGNLAMIGDEAVQFVRAIPLGARRWRLEGLLRARAGSAAPVTGHAAGAPFVLLSDPALVMLADGFAVQASGRDAAIDWQTRGSETMQRAGVPMGQQAMLPLAPVHGQVERLASGAVRVRWIPRSRAGARWRDGVEVPSGELAASWRVAWTDGAGNPVVQDMGAPTVTLGAASYLGGGTLTVVQRGDNGLSASLSVTLP